MNSSGHHVAIATNAERSGLDEDGPALVEALGRRGVTAVPAPWDDPEIDWSSFSAVIVRSTWNYVARRDLFVRWAHDVAAVTRLANPADVLEWNTDKAYLRDLASAGVSVVPTAYVSPGDAVGDIAEISNRLPSSREFVVKPAVSAGALDTARYRVGEDDEALLAHLVDLVGSGRVAMVQPYLDAVDSMGETGLVFLGGSYSHAIEKRALLEVSGAPRATQDGGDSGPREPTREEHEVAEQVLDASGVRERLLYARVDLIPGPRGEPMLIELECTEPFLYLGYDSGAPDRFAGAIEVWLAEA